MDAADKPIVWLEGEVKTPPFSSEARLEAGLLLRRLQRGETLRMPASRPMPSIGHGCHELRIVDRQASWRIVYFVDADAVVILEVFSKKSRETPAAVIASCKRRLKAYRSVEGELVKRSKRNKLESAGWKIGSAGAFLGLTPEEAQVIEVKLALSETLRRWRERRQMTQSDLAERLGSSQSRIAKLESGASGVSLDLLFRALFATGATPEAIAKEIRSRKRPAA